MSFKVTGKLADVFVEEGDRVEQGQKLATLDDIDQRTQLRLAQARLDAMQAQLGQLEAEAEQAQRDLKRQQDLNARKLTPIQTLEDARTRAASLAAQLGHVVLTLRNEEDYEDDREAGAYSDWSTLLNGERQRLLKAKRANMIQLIRGMPSQRDEQR